MTLASYSGSFDCVTILLTKWTYADYSEACIMPPLCVAAMRGHLMLVKLFCSLKPEPTEIRTAHSIPKNHTLNFLLYYFFFFI